MQNICKEKFKNFIIIFNLLTLFLVFSILLIVFSASSKYSVNATRNNKEENINAEKEVKIKLNDNLNNELIKNVAKKAMEKGLIDITNCKGNYIESKVTGRINLNITGLNNWNAESQPTILNETINSKNIVVIGHNLCKNMNCNQPESQFAQIMNFETGDEINLCVKDISYKAYIVKTEIVSENRVEILGEWLDIPSITLFTSYGKCKNDFCSETFQRFVAVGAII
jgi:sortase (surface protein transpeptidase)